MDGLVKERMICKVRSYLRCHVFTPWKILKSMDLAGFNLSLSGLEVLRRVDVGSGKYVRGILPSKSTMLRTARKVEEAAKSICPFRMIGRSTTATSDSQGGGVDSSELDQQHQEEDVCVEDETFQEGFEFDFTMLTRTLLVSFGLWHVAKQRPIDLSLTSDGAQLINTVSHVTAGIKFNDMALCDPMTKEPMLLHEPGSLVQSRKLDFPYRVIVAKDGKKSMNGFRPLYGGFTSGAIARSLGCMPFNMSYPGDMKLQWMALDCGGAAKVKEKFCFACLCWSATLHVPQDKTVCPICMGKEDDNDSNECYHYPFLADPQIREELADELATLAASFSNFNDYAPPCDDGEDPANRKSMYVRRPNDVMMREGDAHDIDCQVDQCDRLRRRWIGNVTDELVRGEMSIAGTVTERHQRL